MSKLAINGGEKLRTDSYVGWPPRDEGFYEALKAVLDSGVWGVSGGRNQEACEKFAAFQDAKFAVASVNGTKALELAMLANDISYGDEVIVPPYTFIATASSVVSIGAVPVFADIDPATFCLDPEAVEAAITPQTRGISAVHIAGMPCDMNALKAVAEKHNLVLIEDCAQAHGAEYEGTKVGAIGDAGGFSFQSSKNVTAGEGGMTVTNKKEVFEKAWSYHNIGRVPDGGWYDHRVFGTNLRLTEFQSALILRGLELLPGHMDLRDANAMHLRKRLDEVEGVGYQEFSPGATRCAWHLFIFRYDREKMNGVSRDKFVAAVAAEGIPVGKGYNPLYREGMFQKAWDRTKPPFAPSVYSGDVDYTKTHCPNCEFVCDDGAFWMGQSPLLGTTKDMDDVADAIIKVKENLGELE